MLFQVIMTLNPFRNVYDDICTCLRLLSYRYSDNRQLHEEKNASLDETTQELIKALNQRKSVNFNYYRIHGDISFEEALSMYPEKKSVQKLTYCDNGNIEKIPEIIALYENLTSLVVQNCSISAIPWSIIYLKNIKVINLSNNHLECLPNTISHLTTLEQLCLSKNLLQTLPTSLLKLTNLWKIDVRENTTLKSPTLAICNRGRDAIFAALEKRLTIRNVWEKSTPWIDENNVWNERGLKTLVELCIETVLECNVNFQIMPYIPPHFKDYLSVREKMKMTSIDVAKCMSCSKYFSSIYTLEMHNCC